jgi:valyl-tRNA synthetase
MVSVLDICLRLLHPYMPYMTEEAWNYIPHEGEALIMAKWPESDVSYIDETAEAQMNQLMDMVRAVRETRTEYKVDPSNRVSAIIAPGSQRANLERYDYVFARLCNVENVDLLDDNAPAPENSASAVVSDMTIYLPLEGMLDLEKECARLSKEQEKTAKEIKGTEAKLSNESFVSKAPEHVVQRERDKLAELQAEAAKIEQLLATLCD